MENLETIIKLLYKRVSAQRVIEEAITYDDFNQNEFISMANSYMFNYSENEALNLLNYYMDTFCEMSKWEGRFLERKLNVFEALFYYSKKFLVINNNEILCQYQMLLYWRKMTLELSEDTIIAAFLAQNRNYSEMACLGFSWPRITGHNNVQINTIMQRGISENHSHLNGAAPIFQISWLSLMNNVNATEFSKFLRAYDYDRRYTNVAYISVYGENSFHHKYMQAALIRLLLYNKLTGERWKIGKYNVKICHIAGLLFLPEFHYKAVYENVIKNNPSLNQDILDYLENSIKQKYSLKEVFQLFCMNIDDKEPDWEIIFDLNPIFTGIINGNLGKRGIIKNKIIELIKENIDNSFSQLFFKLLLLLEEVSIEDIQELFIDNEVFKSIWEERTLKNVKELLRNPENIIYEQNNIQLLIDSFRFNGTGGNVEAEHLDYALRGIKYNTSERRKINFVFSGERWITYVMFRKIYLKEQEYAEYYNLFYAYLLIKESIRSELIQSNNNTGFVNFEKYQRRKGDLLADSIYRSMYSKLVISDSLISKNIIRTELRIAPLSTVEKNYKMIRELDKLLNPYEKKDLFYVIHFIKNLDNVTNDIDYIYCRHYKKRKDNEQKAYALTGLRERYPLIGERILGIDAASNEIGCRPEVFAPVFRFLREHRCYYYTRDNLVKMPQLKVTYHVGEDFLDLADGIRAIDEAINFLNLGLGDRMGHALALGIDAKEWYSKKRYHITLPVQDYLDNLVWIFHKLYKYNIQGFENLKEWIQSKYSVLFSKLYSADISKSEMYSIMEKSRFQGAVDRKMDFGIFNYYHAWQLRGDDPQFYEFGYLDEKKLVATQENFRININYPSDYEVRLIPEVAMLYYMYHYNKRIREEGKKTIEVVVKPDYVNAVAAIQKVLQRKVAKRGISIETNPSSNYLIGTFRQYKKHPILQFYNKGLTHNPDELKKCPQIPVSINTDDQGVFNTSLENEYALIACALESAVSDDGKLLYNRQDIYEWLDNIRIMGNEQNFGYIALHEKNDM